MYCSYVIEVVTSVPCEGGWGGGAYSCEEVLFCVTDCNLHVQTQKGNFAGHCHAWTVLYMHNHIPLLSQLRQSYKPKYVWEWNPL